ncbi:MAG TPA: bifunctional diaminohydroxyphosphoribosylaminopyrimidine deaminase/5-amino-6-(5-phosphoribosylamino)uracil reductase RibD [Cyclobacteriaceae bacterium]|nr:bifunctional diaminohydroxyphosphoribosylaminopyrimidine deaminase/5-amino-6-(5-phosphoribosylamino)uracil reductase RibD [Cyclobacteriaceae bacterium]
MEDTQAHENFMQRAINLALLGLGSVSPNPLVGCVIVHEEKIIAEGWHKKFGGPHAEVNAIEALADKSLLPVCIVYVNLEPCSHFGKTPPCADMLIAHGVKRVVIANQDPNPVVAGKGIQKLRAAGVEVIENILADEGKNLNRRFFTFIEKQRPYIMLKWAQTADGFIAREDYSSKWISNEQARQLVHKWRAEEDAVMVGTNTAQYDNPKLNLRHWQGRNPLRIVIDRNLRLNNSLHLFDKTQKTLCYNLLKNEKQENLEFVKLADESFLKNMLNDLYQKGIQSVMVEGGAYLINQFIEEGLWDEARVFEADINFDKGIKAPELNVKPLHTEAVAEDALHYFINH